MRRWPLVGVLLAVVAFTPLEGATFQCVSREPCPVDENGVRLGQPHCCQNEPPCEFFAWRERAMAARRMWREDVVKKALDIAGGDEDKAEEVLNTVSPPAVEPPCEEKGQLPQGSYLVPDFDALVDWDSPNCEVSRSKDDVHRESEGCEELVEVYYTRLFYLQEACLNMKQRGLDDVDLASWARMERESAEAERIRLDSSIEQFIKQCSHIRDLEQDELIQATGLLDELVRLTPQGPKPSVKKKASPGKKSGPAKANRSRGAR